MGEIFDLSSFTEGVKTGLSIVDDDANEINGFLDQIYDRAIQSIEPENRTFKNVVCRAFAEILSVLMTDEYLNMPYDEFEKMNDDDEQSKKIIEEVLQNFEDRTGIDLTDYIPR